MEEKESELERTKHRKKRRETKERGKEDMEKNNRKHEYLENSRIQETKGKITLIKIRELIKKKGERL